MAKEVSDRVVIILIVIAVIAAALGTAMVYRTATLSPSPEGLSSEGNVIYENPSGSGKVSVFVNPIGGGEIG